MNEYYDFQIMYPSTSIDKVVDSDRIAIGGSITNNTPANQADVTQHSFIPLNTDVEVVLFDNTGGDTVDHQLVVFSEPMHDLPEDGTTVDGITMHEHNCNYAIISGSGKLVGKRYTHTQMVVTASEVEDDEEVRSKQVTENYLINVLNSQNTALRVLSYYSATDSIKSKIFLSGERPGDFIQLSDPFKDVAEAYIEKMEVVATALLTANCEMVQGFNPQFVGNNFKESVLIDENSSWTVPDGITHLKVALVGGAQGGQGGYDGHRGEGYNVSFGADIDFYFNFSRGIFEAYYPSQSVYDGGAAGNPGSAGKIYVFDIDVTPGDTLTFSVGTGGVGGNPNGGIGTNGTPTTVTIGGVSYTSESGNVVDTGYLYIIRNEVYGAPGEVGHKGGKGGATNTESLQGWQYADGLPGENVGSWTGGSGGRGIKAKWWGGGPEEDRSYNVASGGGGGGAAWGANGKDTHYDSAHGLTYTNTPQFYNGTNYSVQGAFGGDGANALPPETPLYGCGGGGGNGGGSGGNAGGGKVTNHFSDDPTVEPRVIPQMGGNPGLGSRGGDGGAGCGIIFY